MVSKLKLRITDVLDRAQELTTELICLTETEAPLEKLERLRRCLNGLETLIDSLCEEHSSLLKLERKNWIV